jgi:hypothetical protein
MESTSNEQAVPDADEAGPATDADRFGQPPPSRIEAVHAAASALAPLLPSSPVICVDDKEAYIQRLGSASPSIPSDSNRIQAAASQEEAS